MLIDKNTEALLKGTIAVDPKTGKHYIRVITEEGLTLENAASTKSTLTFRTLLNNCIVLDENDNPAINLAAVKFGKTITEKKTEAKKESFDAETKRQKKLNKEYTDRRDAKKKADKEQA